MTRLRSIATYLPVWGDDRRRIAGTDEDAVTLAVAAGRAALAAAGGGSVEAVVFVTRDLPLLEGGSEGVLLAALDLDAGVRCTTVVGGAPAVLDAISTAAATTLVIAAEIEPAAAAGAVVVSAEDGAGGAGVTQVGRSSRSLPVTARDAMGHRSEYDDPRLLRVRGSGTAIEALGLEDKPVAVVGLSAKDAASYTRGASPALPSLGSAAVAFALAVLVEQRTEGIVVAVEQASATAAQIGVGATTLTRLESPPRPRPSQRLSAEGDIKLSLAAYERAFDGKLRLAAGRCTTCGTLHLPQRYRCTECGDESGQVLQALPREAVVYTAVTIRVPVPGLLTPYDLVIVELGDTGVRLLAPVTGASAGDVAIDDAGELVLRRIAIRAGVPDYGYAFLPASQTAATTEGVA